MTPEIKLKRNLNLPLLVLYGLGTTIGAGIFVLTGKVAGKAGMHAPVSFLMASLLAMFTAISFAELSSRYPRSAGEAVYVREGLNIPFMALLVGILVAMAGTVSAAAIVNGSVGYITQFLPIPRLVLMIAIPFAIGLIAVWGIKESVVIASVLTLVEIGGLGLVVWAGSASLADLPARLPELIPSLDGAAWSGISIGAMLAFYAFLGFEDMVNVAEEVREAPRTLPTAIFLTLLITTLLYVLVALVAVLSIPSGELAASGAPLTLIYERGSGGDGHLVTLISVFAILNGALIQIIMVSRIFYGLADQDLLPKALATINPVTRTPLTATVLVTAMVSSFGIWLPIEPLAVAASSITLVIFALINLSLLRIKWRVPAPEGAQTYSVLFPLTGFVVSLGFLIHHSISYLDL